MTKSNEQLPMDFDAGPRRWVSGDEFWREADEFMRAARHFIGRGEPEDAWSESQRLRLELAHIIETAGTSAAWCKRLHHMIRSAESVNDAEHRRLAVQAIERWGEAWKQRQWQVSVESRRICLMNLVVALETLDPVFGALRRELGTLATKLDEYAAGTYAASSCKTGERVLAELIVEGTDALGFDVEPRESVDAEVRRIERQLFRDTTPRLVSTKERRSARRLRRANSIETDEGRMRLRR